MPDKYLIVVAGPTAVGKTKVSITLARHFGTEIINADSRQVYTELQIGVGKPTAEELNEVNHYLVGQNSIHYPYSAGQYEREAMEVLHQLFKKYDVAILTGGTGLYIKAIIEGLDVFPDVPQSFTDKWTEVWKSGGIPALVEALKQYDPEYLKIVDAENPMRLIRALAVSESSGTPYTTFRSGMSVERDFTVIPILLERPREELYDRINQRVNDLMNQGWLEEARTLYPHRFLKALDTVGYPELFDVIDGKMELADAITEIQQKTRNYAKRQITWWNNQGEWHHFHPNATDEMIAFITAQISST